ncbi:DUF3370 domain-containing protein [Leptolyngbya sp. FACHB-261]|uniref:DUF3370 domain-containing protein n=1 Tax=Leptolyngbya sp. FACHB-261 TaxID=2692806 RepID=UPI001683E942|nr:DUF3370 domain-containing protein [Leptolyngbya sp. FACHB-261]MBD2099610.1 DUF3370 domain-containing protein [Leptolyngbya sp. FACHB-261]
MLPFLPTTLFVVPATPVAAPVPTALSVPVSAPQEVLQLQEVRTLPGQLDTVPVFNSNSPEVVQTEGILLSTFPSQSRRHATAHLNSPLQGRFDVFAHHIARTATTADARTLFFGVIIENPSSQPITVEVMQAASYLSTHDAPFIDLPSYLEDPLGRVYAGPGSRAMSDVLRGRRQGNWPSRLVIPAHSRQMLVNLPIPSSNSRSTMMRLWSSAPVYLASLAMYAPLAADGTERVPTLEQWQVLLDEGDLASPRDLPPSPLEAATDPTVSRFFYGRVAGIALGSQWQARITDSPSASALTIPQRGQAFSYGLSTLNRGTLGTGQVQSAPMLVRYPDTAYRAHGNYGVQYNLTLPLHNTTNQTQRVALAIQTPIKEDKLTKQGLRFFEPPDRQVFFRGTVRVRYSDDQGQPQTRYVHIVQRRGEEGQPLVVLNMPAGDRRLLEVDFIYPPDSTPPQVLTVQTLAPEDIASQAIPQPSHPQPNQPQPSP